MLALVLGTGRRAPEARDPLEILVITAISDGALVLVLFALGRARLGIRAVDLGFRAPTLAALRDAVGIALALWVVSIGVNAIAVRIFGPHPQSFVVTAGAHSGPVDYAVDMLTGAVVAPLAEEPFFRGLIFGGFAQRIPIPAAAAVSALLFAVSHGLGVALPIFFLGLGLAYVYWRTGSIWASITTHATVNAVSLSILFLQPR